MSYNVDELFSFKENKDGYALVLYLKNVDLAITELELPAEYNGKPVVIVGSAAFRQAQYLEKVTIPEGVRWIGAFAFGSCPRLTRVSLPASLEAINLAAFASCGKLREVEFKSCPMLEEGVFRKDLGLPPELFLAGVLRSLDLTQAPLDDDLRLEMHFAKMSPQTSWLVLRPDVFALALNNDCFRLIGAKTWFRIFKILFKYNCAEQLKNAENYDVLNAALLGELIELSAKRGETELTAYLLELKKQKFGFNNGGDFEL